jgi:hypothetical protein
MAQLRNLHTLIERCMALGDDLQARMIAAESSGASPATLTRLDRIGELAAIDLERFVKSMSRFVDAVDRELDKRPPQSRPPTARPPARLYSFRSPKKGPRR